MTSPLKNHALLGSQYRIDGTSGNIINTNHQRIAEMVNDLDPQLRLCWIPSKDRLPTDTEPFALVCTQGNGEEYVVMNLSEDRINESLIGYILAAKTGGVDNPLTRQEAMEAAQELAKQKKWEDDLAEAREVMAAVLKSKKHVYKHGGKTYRD